MDSEHETLLFYSKVRWLSKGNVMNRVFELRGELKLFLEMQGSHFNVVLWEPRLAYLADISEQLNRLNLKLQGKEKKCVSPDGLSSRISCQAPELPRESRVRECCHV